MLAHGQWEYISWTLLKENKEYRELHEAKVARSKIWKEVSLLISVCPPKLSFFHSFILEFLYRYSLFAEMRLMTLKDN